MSEETLTLGKLADVVNSILAHNPQAATNTVCIPNNKGGMGGTSVTNVENVGGGIDWDAHKFFIWPRNKMIEAGQEPIKDWKTKANEWALSRMPKGWDVDKATAEEIHSFYVWMLMFIRDCYSIYQKHI